MKPIFKRLLSGVLSTIMGLLFQLIPRKAQSRIRIRYLPLQKMMALLPSMLEISA